ncbi:MAG: acetolactate decarboxylase [Phycisphaerales bacterium]|nr:acetolactate decarboxylase [Phycisphaerales bacterium]
MFLIALVGLFLVGGCSTYTEPLIQVGTLQGLLAGEYEGTVTLKDLPGSGWYGMIGLGTFDALDGEMVIIDGVCYRVPTTGHVTVMKPTDTTPFANVACIDHASEWNMWEHDVTDYASLKKYVLSQIDDPTRPYAIRIDARFASVKTRSVPKQSKPYRKLIDVVKTGQVVFDIDPDPKGWLDAPGTIVGFYFPPSFKGVNVVGFHLHFLTADRSAGGHLLDFKYNWTKNPAKIQLAPLDKKIRWVGKKGEVRESSHEEIKAIEQGK